MFAMLEALSQMIKPPHQLVSAQTGLFIPTALQPGESPSEDDPPGWDKREENWTIDELLGQYEAQQREITIFTKGIEHAAPQLATTPSCLEYIVRIHEWAHANFHLGVTPERCVEITKADLRNDEDLLRIAGDGLTADYTSVDPYVHEQIAQSVTWLALEDLRAQAKADKTKEACARLCETFTALTQRQPAVYQVDHLLHLEREQLRNRLRAVIDLIRNGDVRAYRKAWDTIMPW
jgi:hypothetical protein